MKLTLIKTFSYKGKTIVMSDNGFCYYIFIVGERKQFGSVADAKKYINGKPTTWQVQDTSQWAEFNDAADALVAEHNL